MSFKAGLIHFDVNGPSLPVANVSVTGEIATYISSATPVGNNTIEIIFTNAPLAMLTQLGCGQSSAATFTSPVLARLVSSSIFNINVGSGAIGTDCFLFLLIKI